jgi:RNA polymerase sigma factor (sigma-70 family)
MAPEHMNAQQRTGTDRELIARFIDARDEGAFGEMVRRYGPLVLGVCRRVLGEMHDSEDAFQATFLVLARDASKIRNRNSLASWLHGVAYRIARRAAKRKARQMADLLEDLAGSDSSVLEHIAYRHDERMIDEELNKLPAKDRETLTLRYLEDRSNSDIAVELKISVAAVEGRLKRARYRLRRQLLLRGVSLSAFLGIVAATRVGLHAVEPLIPATVHLGIAGATGHVIGSSIPHQLAATELGEMAISVKSILAVAAATVLVGGLGFYGLSGHAVGQESAPASPVAIEGSASGVPAGADQQAEPVDVMVITTRQSPGTAPPSPTSATTLRRLGAAAKIAEALDTETVLEFNETPLSEVVDYLKTARNIPVMIDRRALDSIGLGSETPITICIAGVSLRSSLTLMLNELDLDYMVAHEMLIITSREVAQSQLDPRIYSTANLNIPVEKLIEIIQSMVAPTTWEEVGGMGKITSLGDTLPGLVIAQTDQVHNQIADLLEKLRQAEAAAQ